MDRHLKTNRISTGYNRVTVLSGPIQSGGTSTMVVDKVSRRLIAKGQYFRNLGRWSWMLPQGNNSIRTIIITTYWPVVSASVRGAYSQQLEALAIMKIQNDPRTQFWIDLNTKIYKWIHQGEKKF